jgi:predicted dehydrogenase
MAQPSRRTFIESAAAGLIVAPRVLAAEGAAAAKPAITVGLVGVGSRGSQFAGLLARHAGFKVTAVADYFAPTAERVGERLGVPKARCFSGLGACQRLLASKVDAVLLETPPYFFPQHAKAAVEAGCHVYMAKPVAVDVPGCLAILAAGQAARRAGKVFLVDFQTRTCPFHREGIQRVHDGFIGPVGLIHSWYHDDGFGDPPLGKTWEGRLRGLVWVNDNVLGGGYLVNAGIHAVDVALWAANATPQSAVGVSARKRPRANGDTHDTYALTYTFANGAAMAHTGEHIANATGRRIGCLVYGQRGHLATDYGGTGLVQIRATHDVWQGGADPGLFGHGMERNLQTFYESIAQGNASNPTIEPAVNATLATILGREAGLQGRCVTWEELLRDTRRLELDTTGLTV